MVDPRGGGCQGRGLGQEGSPICNSVTDPVPPAPLVDINGLPPDGALMGFQLSPLRTKEATCYLQRLRGF